MLEDNDPTGFLSRKGVDAKKRSGMSVFTIPRRSPDLNVMDYAVWAEVTRRMRASEASWAATRRESRDEYVARLRKTARAIPKAFIEKAVCDMKRRCQRMYEKKGGFIQEGK